MTADSHPKVTASHVKRNAYVCIRQSTIRQIFENTESTQRQYALRERAVALGWREDQIVVVDGDTAHTAASAAGREGFQQLVIQVGLGHAGLVMGLEVSRLARNCSDWHRLLELCALTDTLILDEEAMYDANQFNDRLLLGLKGAMSEAVSGHSVSEIMHSNRIIPEETCAQTFPTFFFSSPSRLTALACNLPVSSTATGVPAQSLQPMIEATETPVLASTQTSLPATETLTALPTETPEPSATATVEIPKAQVNRESNCRTGPGGLYNLVATYQAGQILDILAKDLGSAYWFVQNPDKPDEQCYVMVQNVTVEGDTSALPKFTPQPTQVS